MAWKKGQTGNPKGRPRTVAGLKEAAQAHTETALHVLAGIMADDTVQPNARVQAAQALLDRGYGKPPQHNTNETDMRVTQARWLTQREAEALEAKQDSESFRTIPEDHSKPSTIDGNAGLSSWPIDGQEKQ